MENDNPEVNAEELDNIRNYLKEEKAKRITLTPEQANPTNPLSPLHRPAQKPKLIVIKGIHHRNHNGIVQTLTVRHTRELSSEDDPLTRTITVGEEWQVLDTAWIKSLGYLSFRNNGWKPFQVIPTIEQRQEAWSKVIEIGYSLPKQIIQDKLPVYDKRNPRTAFEEVKPIPTNLVIEEIEPLWVIYPGESQDGRPVKDRKIYVRCQHGQTYLTIFAIPE